MGKKKKDKDGIHDINEARKKVEGQGISLYMASLEASCNFPPNKDDKDTTMEDQPVPDASVIDSKKKKKAEKKMSESQESSDKENVVEESKDETNELEELAKSDQPEKSEEPTDIPTTEAIEDKTTSSIGGKTQSAEKGKKKKSDVKESGGKNEIEAVVTQNSNNVRKKKKMMKVKSNDRPTIGSEAKTENNSGEKPKKK